MMANLNMKTLTYPEFEKLELETNAHYLEQCRNLDAYRELTDDMKQWPTYPLMNTNHLALRGRYEHYPSCNTVSFAKDKRDQPYFIKCSNCGRQHCTDAWLPFGYSSFWDRVHMAGDGSKERPYLYYCRDRSHCAPTGKNAEDTGAPMRLAINYRCTYERCH